MFSAPVWDDDAAAHGGDNEIFATPGSSLHPRKKAKKNKAKMSHELHKNVDRFLNSPSLTQNLLSESGGDDAGHAAAAADADERDSDDKKKKHKSKKKRKDKAGAGGADSTEAKAGGKNLQKADADVALKKPSLKSVTTSSVTGLSDAVAEATGSILRKGIRFTGLAEFEAFKKGKLKRQRRKSSGEAAAAETQPDDARSDADGPPAAHAHAQPLDADGAPAAHAHAQPPDADGAPAAQPPHGIPPRKKKRGDDASGGAAQPPPPHAPIAPPRKKKLAAAAAGGVAGGSGGGGSAASNGGAAVEARNGLAPFPDIAKLRTVLGKALSSSALGHGSRPQSAAAAASAAQTTPDSRRQKRRDEAQSTLKSSRFRYLNELLYTQTGSESLRMFTQDPEAFAVYHEGFTLQSSRWPVDPLTLIITALTKSSSIGVVADFGCGSARLSRELAADATVHSFDLVAANDRVTVCDMSKTPLADGCVDVAVFCLALMGTNLRDYLKEANRVLKLGGTLKIAEVESRFSAAAAAAAASDDDDAAPSVDAFVDVLEKFGFKLKWKDLGRKFFYLMDFEKVGKAKKKAPQLALKACRYKKR